MNWFYSQWITKLEKWLILKIQLYRRVRKKDRFLAVLSGQSVPNHVKVEKIINKMEIELERVRFALHLVEQSGRLPGDLAELVAERL